MHRLATDAIIPGTADKGSANRLAAAAAATADATSGLHCTTGVLAGRLPARLSGR